MLRALLLSLLLSAPSGAAAAARSDEPPVKVWLVDPETVQALAAAAPRKRSPNPTWCDEEADRHGTQVENPGRQLIPAPAGKLPRTDLRLSHRGRRIAGGNEMEIV